MVRSDELRPFENLLPDDFPIFPGFSSSKPATLAFAERHSVSRPFFVLSSHDPVSLYPAKLIAAGEARNTGRSLYHCATAFRAGLCTNRSAFPRFSRSQDLLALATITKDGDPLAFELMRQEKDALDIPSRGRAREIRGFAHGILHVPLKDRLHPDVPLRCNVMRGHENTPDGFRDFFQIPDTTGS